MKTTGITAGLACGVLLQISAAAWADCGCFCVDGALKTMCSTVEEAQGNPSLCAFYGGSCPQEQDDSSGASYDAPAEGATDCRDRRVFDPLSRSFVTIKACDVLSPG